MRKKRDEVIYQLTIGDIQEVADQELGRELSVGEIELVRDRVGDYISWYDAIALAIDEKIIRGSQRQQT